jgi:predicted transcriptional regulator
MNVKEIMTAPVVTVTEDTPVPEIATVLQGRRISAVPVLDAGDAVVGAVSEYDLPARPGGTAAQVMTRTVISVTETPTSTMSATCWSSGASAASPCWPPGAWSASSAAPTSSRC